jgi:hypothetical protein
MRRGTDRIAHNVVMDYNLSWPPLATVDGTETPQDIPLFGDLPVLGDPLFINPENYNFGLRKGSPALDAGYPDAEWKGPDGTRADLGAFPRPNRLPIVPYAGRAPRVDGDLSDWDGIAPAFAEHFDDPEAVRLCWREEGLYGAVRCQADASGTALQGLDRADSLLLCIQTDGTRPCEYSEHTFRWYLCPVGPQSSGIAEVDQRPPRGSERRGPDESAPSPEGMLSAWRRTEFGYELEFFFPAECLKPAKLEPGAEFPAYLCLTGKGARIAELGQRAVAGIDRTWLSPSVWLNVRLGRSD